MMARQLEPEMKASVLNHLRGQGKISHDSVVINELTLNGYKRRVDVAFVTANRFYAVEIKSAADSLYRLQGQVEKYAEYFDKIIIAAATKHIKRILEDTPDFVAVWEVLGDEVIVRRKGRYSPLSCSRKYIDLMKLDELQKISCDLKLDSRPKTRRQFAEVLQVTSVKKIKQYCLSFIEGRYRETSHAFWSAIKGRKVIASDISLLSKNRVARETQKIHLAEQTYFWESLAKRDNCDFQCKEVSDGFSFGHVPEEIQRLLAS